MEKEGMGHGGGGLRRGEGGNKDWRAVVASSGGVESFRDAWKQAVCWCSLARLLSNVTRAASLSIPAPESGDLP